MRARPRPNFSRQRPVRRKAEDRAGQHVLVAAVGLLAGCTRSSCTSRPRREQRRAVERHRHAVRPAHRAALARVARRRRRGARAPAPAAPRPPAGSPRPSRAPPSGRSAISRSRSAICAAKASSRCSQSARAIGTVPGRRSVCSAIHGATGRRSCRIAGMVRQTPLPRPRTRYRKARAVLRYPWRRQRQRKEAPHGPRPRSLRRRRRIPRLRRQRHRGARGARAGPQAAGHVRRRHRRAGAAPPGRRGARQRHGRGGRRPRQPHRGRAPRRLLADGPRQRPRHAGRPAPAVSRASRRSR